MEQYGVKAVIFVDDMCDINEKNCNITWRYRYPTNFKVNNTNVRSGIYVRM